MHKGKKSQSHTKLQKQFINSLIIKYVFGRNELSQKKIGSQENNCKNPLQSRRKVVPLQRESYVRRRSEPRPPSFY